jgi:predicted DNA-binding protein (UPF0251 family)
LWNEETYGGNFDTICLRVDLERALQSNALTPQQRQMLALYYICGLSQDECSILLKTSRRTVIRRLKSARFNIVEHIQGKSVDRVQCIDSRDKIPIEKGVWLSVWMNGVLKNVDRWWDMDIVLDGALRDICDLFGYPINDGEYEENTQEEYPILTDGQLRSRNRNREILRPEIYPSYENYGQMTSTDGRKIRLSHYVS